MSTSPLSPRDIRAAAEVHHELGPEYSDAVVANFVDQLEDVINERVNARLAALPPQPVVAPARRRRGPVIAVVAGACGAMLLVGAAGLGITVGKHAEPAVPTVRVSNGHAIPQAPAVPPLRVPHPRSHVHVLIKRSTQRQS
jgi:hypothetical protein